ncbi:MAG: phosphatidate cytidylyltransferase [Candidatus Omnitrophica bacterium]|nr:phosphatidate cytidylyltransferase [Candidatus Omnitrophota bacterium]
MGLCEANFIKRFLSAVLIAAFVFWAIFIAGFYIYGAIVITIATVALWEFYRILAKRYGSIYPGIGFIISFLLFILSLNKNLGFEYMVYPLSLSLILLFLYQMIRKTNKDAAMCLGLTMLGLIYVTIPGIFLIKIRLLDNGPFLIAYYIFVIKSTDVGAYLVGMKFGKHPLIPRISPGKSLEGFIGGMIFSVLAAYFGSFFVGVILPQHITIIGLILGICAQFGDLAESVLKRDAGVKDSGSAVPGLGGVLDLVDSLLIAVPFYYLYIDIFIIR